MTNNSQNHNELNTLKNQTDEEAIDNIGNLVDKSWDQKDTKGFYHAIKLIEEIQKRSLSITNLVQSHFIVANTWSNLRALSRLGKNKIWEFEQKEAEKEIFHYRKALDLIKDTEILKILQSKILTNLGNALSYIGRFVEAIEYWDKALIISQLFVIAQGNRGYGLICYALALYDPGHATVLLKKAHTDLKTALLSKIHPAARDHFEKYFEFIKSVLKKDILNKKIDMNNFSLGSTKMEIQYRKWCLKNRLFLNPLNDVGSDPIASCDILYTPKIVVDIDEGPILQGFFNQMKQEYVSSRYLYYEGIIMQKPHFSDKEVLLFNTLDYPSYSIAVEKIKAAFRILYSLFDKIAYFLNYYLKLKIPEKRVSFNTFWYKSQQKDKGIRQEFAQYKNWPLWGLYWLSKDLFENKVGFKESIEPDAKNLKQVRDHLEHKYLKIHEEIFLNFEKSHDKKRDGLSDTLAYSIYRSDFETKTLRLIKIVRAALIYLSLSIKKEEIMRSEERDSDIFIADLEMDIWEDRWKI